MSDTNTVTLTHAQAAAIIDGLTRQQKITLRIMVEERRRGSFAAAASFVLGSNFRVLFANANGRWLSDDEIRTDCYRCVGGGI